MPQEIDAPTSIEISSASICCFLSFSYILNNYSTNFQHAKNIGFTFFFLILSHISKVDLIFPSWGNQIFVVLSVVHGHLPKQEDFSSQSPSDLSLAPVLVVRPWTRSVWFLMNLYSQMIYFGFVLKIYQFPLN